MTITEFILFAGWIVWFAFYFHLAWSKGKASSLGFSIMFFPFFLFIGASWPPGTEVSRMKLQVFALALLVATAIVAIVGESNAS